MSSRIGFDGACTRWRSWRLIALSVVLVHLLAGCVTQQQMGEAIGAVNRAFQAEYEAILAKKGTRVFSASKPQAVDATRAAFLRLGLRLEAEDSALGYLSAAGPAPLPLDNVQWSQASAADLPKLRHIIQPYVGTMSQFVRFEPEGLEAVVTATVVEVSKGAEVSLTVRTREMIPPPSGIPRREYVLPTAVNMGLDKIWSAIEAELANPSGR